VLLIEPCTTHRWRRATVNRVGRSCVRDLVDSAARRTTRPSRLWGRGPGKPLRRDRRRAFFLNRSTKQSPPIPVLCGSTTDCIATAAIAASIALPPARSTSSPARVANRRRGGRKPCRWRRLAARTAGNTKIAHRGSLIEETSVGRRKACPSGAGTCGPSMHAPRSWVQFEIPPSFRNAWLKCWNFPVAGRRRRRGEAKPESPPGVLWLRMPLPFALNHINLWLLEDGPGPGRSSIAALAGAADDRAMGAALCGLSRRPAGAADHRSRHYHPDHIGLAGWLAERWAGALVDHREGSGCTRA